MLKFDINRALGIYSSNRTKNSFKSSLLFKSPLDNQTFLL